MRRRLGGVRRKEREKSTARESYAGALHPRHRADSFRGFAHAWSYLSEVNRKVAVLAPILSRLTSSGIYFTAPASAQGLPLLPGKIIEHVTSTAPVIVGEFSGPAGPAYAMLVNLSLQQSAKLTIKTRVAGQPVRRISATDGHLHAFGPDKECVWLPAGQGVLLRVGD